jgi:hypothetical protein
MAPAYSWLALAAALATVQAQTRTSTRTSSSTYSSSSAFWTYTSRIQDSVSTTVYTGFDETYTDSYTSTRAIKTDASPTATPYSTSTSDSYYYYSYDEDVQYVYAYYSDGAVPESMLEPTYDYSAGLTSTSSDSVYTVFRMPVTYTAPASCPTPFTVSVDETVTVPTEVRDQVTPTSKKTGSVQTYFTYGATQTETWYLSAGAAPLRTSTAYNYEYYVASCSTPYSSESTSGSNYRSGGGDYDDIDVCSWYSGCTSFRTWVIIIACLIPGLFLLGFLESWFWFRRLMLGKGALRFGTISWIMISLWVACFTRAQSKRSPDDQKLLREKWNKTGSGEAFKLWWKWGFRHRYPVPLLGQYSRNTVGIVPEGQPLPQPGQMAGPMYGPGFQPQPGAPVAYYPNGQPYSPPPQGWVPAPNGQGYMMPPPGQAYMPPPNGAVSYYGDQPKENTSVTERTVSPLPETQATHPAPNSPTTVQSPPSTVPSPPLANVAEAPSPVHQPAQAYQPAHSPVSDVQPPPGPPPTRPT